MQEVTFVHLQLHINTACCHNYIRDGCIDIDVDVSPPHTLTPHCHNI